MPPFRIAADHNPAGDQPEAIDRLAEGVAAGEDYVTLLGATGTGKTIVAALDYKRLRHQRGDLRLLFVAHRQEILKQSLGAWTAAELIHPQSVA